jgi:uncharacterized membrane protein
MILVRSVDRTVGRAFAGVSVAWAALLPLAAYGASRPHPSAWLWSVTAAIYGLGSTICHQLPARSFHLWSAQLPVCARCTGVYLGAAIVALVTGWRDRSGALLRHAARTIDGRVVFFVAALPSLTTLAFEWASGVTPSNSVRALAGLPLGAAVAWLVIRVN